MTFSIAGFIGWALRSVSCLIAGHELVRIEVFGHTDTWALSFDPGATVSFELLRCSCCRRKLEIPVVKG